MQSLFSIEMIDVAVQSIPQIIHLVMRPTSDKRSLRTMAV